MAAEGSQAPAQAADSEVPTRVSESTAKSGATKWYGWQIAAFDLPVTALQGVTFHAAYLVYGLTYPALWVGAPIIHLDHGNVGRAAISLVLHVGLPFLGAELGCSAGGRHGGPLEDTCDETWFRGGEALGALAATVIDAGLLAYDEVPSDGRPVAAAPTFSAGASGFAVGWAGRF